MNRLMLCATRSLLTPDRFCRFFLVRPLAILHWWRYRLACLPAPGKRALHAVFIVKHRRGDKSGLVTIGGPQGFESTTVTRSDLSAFTADLKVSPRPES